MEFMSLKLAAQGRRVACKFASHKELYKWRTISELRELSGKLRFEFKFVG